MTGFWYALPFLDLDGSSPHPLALYGKEKKSSMKRSVKHLFLFSTKYIHLEQIKGELIIIKNNDNFLFFLVNCPFNCLAQRPKPDKSLIFFFFF